jgi:16S rRNA (cytosine967-C5)-methyltransferase
VNRRGSGRKPQPEKVRKLVFEILTEVNHRDGYSNLILPKALGESEFDVRDRAFATELLYGTLRMQGRHDYLLKQVIDRPLTEVDDGIIDIARLGIHQLFEMRVPTHAAVSESVELAREVLGESKAAYLNAILRKLSSQSLSEWMNTSDEIEDPVARLAIQRSHPEWIVSAYWDLLKDFHLVEAELAANNQAASPTYVTWPGKSEVKEFLTLGGAQTPYSPYGIKMDQAPAQMELIRTRKAGIQDEGSQLVAHLFYQAAQGAESILDICAGPGGKAALLSHLAARDGKSFVGNEISSKRAELVKQVTANHDVWVGDGRRISERGINFDAVLADVPCTGIGALRRRPEVRWRRRVSDLRELTQLQSELIDSAISVTNPGGIFGYATCSPHFAETSAQMTMLHKRHPYMESIAVLPLLPEGLKNANRDDALSLWTSRHNTDAMFLALFRKKG